MDYIDISILYIYIHVIVLDLFNRFIKQIDIAILDI